jgi:hypothetical protein
MSDKFFPDISVGDFAADILKSMAKDPNGLKPALKESTIQSAGAPDVSKVQVPDDFVKLVTEGKKPVRKQVVIQESSENRLASLVDRLSSLIVEAKQLMVEMSPGATTTGNIGVNLAGSGRSRLASKLKNKFKKR